MQSVPFEVSWGEKRGESKDDDTIKTTCNLWLHKEIYKIKSFNGVKRENLESKSKLLEGLNQEVMVHYRKTILKRIFEKSEELCETTLGTIG